jgi:DNA-binding PadR family transcriptional regulator
VSVKHALLALLEQGPRHGYGLKHEFEASLGHTWPLNVGQVYTTLARLERDGLVAAWPEAPAEADRRAYRITGAGREALADWLSSPVPREALARDELLVKVVAALQEGVEPALAVLRGQRTATLELLQHHSRAKADAARRDDLPRLLAVDLLIAHAEADVAWMDRCEARITAGSGGPRTPEDQG